MPSLSVPDSPDSTCCTAFAVSGFAPVCFEAGSGVGGTWYWNRYPGARCDVESLDYSYQFSDELQQQWEWSERYASQPEILRYIEHVAERFDLLRDVQLDTRVLSASFDDAETLWRVETDRGVASAPFFIMATGCLSSAQLPRDRRHGELSRPHPSHRSLAARRSRVRRQARGRDRHRLLGRTGHTGHRRAGP